MSEHTKPPQCGQCAGGRIGSCCAGVFCREAQRRADDWGVRLQPVRDGLECYRALEQAVGVRLIDPPFFAGSGGCIVPPHLRPICTIHTCEIAEQGCKPGDAVWTTKYFKLRDEIGKCEYELEKLVQVTQGVAAAINDW